MPVYACKNSEYRIVHEEKNSFDLELCARLRLLLCIYFVYDALQFAHKINGRSCSIRQIIVRFVLLFRICIQIGKHRFFYNVASCIDIGKVCVARI